MSETEPIHNAGQVTVTALKFSPSNNTNTTQQSTSAQLPVAFNRRELNQILNIYGRQVAAGEWRDYAIDMLEDRAVFSIFRNASEMPIYRVIKNPKLEKKQGAYSIITPTGLIIKRGHHLSQVLHVLTPRPKLMQF